MISKTLLLKTFLYLLLTTNLSNYKKEEICSDDIAKNIIGTWKVNEKSIINFHSDGTYTDLDGILYSSVNSNKKWDFKDNSLRLMRDSKNDLILVALIYSIQSNSCDKIVLINGGTFTLVRN